MVRHRSTAVLTIRLALELSACQSAGTGACSSAERDFLRAIEHFDGLELEVEDHPWGICGATFTTDATADAVAEHYVAQLRSTGWKMQGPESTGPAGEPGVAGTRSVSAYEGTFQYHVIISTLESGPVQVDITAGDSQQ